MTNPRLETPPVLAGAEENRVYALWVASPDRAEVEQELLRLIRQHVGRLRWRILRDGSPDACEDMTADVFMRLQSFRGESTFSTWLHAVIHNACVNEGKKRKRWQLVPLEDAEAEAASTSVAEARVQAQDLLERVGPRDRKLLEMWTAGADMHELEQAFGVSRTAIRKRLVRLMKEMKDGTARK